jgi:hypothetical protein
MLRGGVELVGRVMGGAVMLAAVLSGVVGVPVASAGTDGQGIGLEYSAPVRYVEVCGDNQAKPPAYACMGGPVAESSPAPPYQTAWFVSGSDVIYGNSPPQASPHWWWVGQVHIWTYSSTTSQTSSTYVGDTVCVIPTSQSGNWVGCKFITIAQPSPPPPPPTPSPPSYPPPTSPPASSAPSTSVSPAPSACGEPSGTSHGLRLQAAVRRAKSARKAKITVGYRQRAIVSGRVLTAGGSPVPGATVCITARNDVLGARALRIATVTTDAHGRFSYAWRATCSRRLWLTSDAGGGLGSATVLVSVRASVSVQATPTSLFNGQVMTLTGHLQGGPLPRGAIVEMQVFRGTYWETFGTANADRHRIFSFPYRFTNTLTTWTYVFRAFVPPQPGDAFAAGWSRPIPVLVSG